MTAFWRRTAWPALRRSGPRDRVRTAGWADGGDLGWPIAEQDGDGGVDGSVTGDDGCFGATVARDAAAAIACLVPGVDDREAQTESPHVRHEIPACFRLERWTEQDEVEVTGSQHRKSVGRCRGEVEEDSAAPSGSAVGVSYGWI